MKKFYENKIFIIVSLFLIFGAVAVIASTIGDSGYSGIQVDNYFTGSGKQGITQNISFNDSNSNNHFLEFEDGLLVNYSFEEAPDPLFPSSGLVAYYKLDGENGSVIDETGNHNATNNGSTRGVTGKIGNAFSFDGADDYVRKQTWPSMDSYSWSYWIKANNLSYNATVINQGGNPEAGLSSPFSGIQDSKLYFGVYNGGDSTAYSTESISTDQWYNVVGTYDGTDSKIYVDGVLDSVSSQPGDQYNTANFYLGGSIPYNNNYFNGTLDELGIWNRALTVSEIEDLYNNGQGLTYS